MSRYVLTYWWYYDLPPGLHADAGGIDNPPDHLGRLGVVEVVAQDVLSAVTMFRDSVGDTAHKGSFGILSAVLVEDEHGEPQLEIAARHLSVSGSGMIEVLVDVVGRSGDEAARFSGAGTEDPYVVTGIIAGDDQRVVQKIGSASPVEAIETVVMDWLKQEESVPTDAVEVWSVVERTSYSTHTIWVSTSSATVRPGQVGPTVDSWFNAEYAEYAPKVITSARLAAARTGAPAAVVRALHTINTHRRALGMTPLDPRAAGWSDEDVVIEADRVARLPNPLLNLKRRVLR